MAYTYIAVDGTRVTNNSTINWAGSTMPEQHCFEAVGAADLASGSHTVQLVAVSSSLVTFGADTDLLILTSPAARISQATLAADTNALSFDTYGITDGTPVPTTSVLTTTIYSDDSPIVALASGRSYYAGAGQNYGDAMWNMSIDGTGEHNDSATWSDNDTFTGAELQAPMYNQGFFSGLSAGSHVISLDATNEPYVLPGNDQVWYRVGATTSLVALNGGMTVFGKYVLNSQVDTRFANICVGSTSGWPGCPSTGTDFVLVSTTINIPVGHNGVVLFAANNRVQADAADQGGTLEFWITVDNQTGIIPSQQLGYPDSVSTRTVCTSYLTAGTNALAPGNHTVEVHARAVGTFIHLTMFKDLPLIWFD